MFFRPEVTHIVTQLNKNREDVLKPLKRKIKRNWKGSVVNLDWFLKIRK